MTVYGLVDPRRPHVVRYVGATRDLKRRLYGHNNPVARCTDHRTLWAARVRASGYRISAIVLAEARSATSAYAIERHYIRLFTALGFRLLNSTTGGTNGFQWSERSRRKMSEGARGNTIRRGAKHKRATVERLRALGRLRRHSAETRAKMRRSHLGSKYKKMSATGRRNISIALRAYHARRRRTSHGGGDLD